MCINWHIVLLTCCDILGSRKCAKLAQIGYTLPGTFSVDHNGLTASGCISFQCSTLTVICFTGHAQDRRLSGQLLPVITTQTLDHCAAAGNHFLRTRPDDSRDLLVLEGE